MAGPSASPSPWIHLPRSFIVWMIVLCSTWILYVNANHDAKRLYDDLLRKRNYNKLIRPVGNTSESLVIKLGIKLTQIIDVDERNEILALNMWVIQEWVDVNLRWNPDEYGGVSMLYVPSELIWLPDIVLYNNADGDYVVTMNTKATISWYGGVKWSPPAIFKSYCNIDVEYFPFDQQDCDLKFGSWSYDGLQVDVKHFWHERLGKNVNATATVDPGMDINAFYQSVEWDLMSASARKNIKYYPCCDEPYPDVSFYIRLRRKTLFYTINLIIPCVSITLLTVLEFYLPSDCGEKISLCISLLLSLSLFQLLLMEIIPPTSTKVPLVGKYILLTTIFVSFSVLLSVVVLNINFRSDNSHDMPRWMKRLFLDFLPRYLWMSRPPQLDDEGGEAIDFDQPYSDLSNYENPYKKKFRPLFKEQSTENLYMKVNYASTFIGMENIDMAAYCQACHERVPSTKFPPHVIKALDGVPYIAKHLQEEDDGGKVKAKWCYMALVVDRILLWSYIGICGFSTVFILMNAPALYDSKSPMTSGL